MQTFTIWQCYGALAILAALLIAGVVLLPKSKTVAKVANAASAYRIGASVLVNEGGSYTWQGTYMGTELNMCIIREAEAPYATAAVYREQVYPMGTVF